MCARKVEDVLRFNFTGGVGGGGGGGGGMQDVC